MMKILMLTALVLFSSCNVPKIENQVRKVWSVQFRTCYCQWYDLNKVKYKTKMKRCDDFYFKNFPQEPQKPNDMYCDDLVGFDAEVWAKKITPWGREVYRYGRDQQ